MEEELKDIEAKFNDEQLVGSDVTFLEFSTCAGDSEQNAELIYEANARTQTSGDVGGELRGRGAGASERVLLDHYWVIKCEEFVLIIISFSQTTSMHRPLRPRTSNRSPILEAQAQC